MFKFYNYLIFKIPILCIFSNKQKKKNSKKLKKTKAGNQKKPKEKMGHEEPKPFPDILDFVFCFFVFFFPFFPKIPEENTSENKIVSY